MHEINQCYDLPTTQTNTKEPFPRPQWRLFMNHPYNFHFHYAGMSHLALNSVATIFSLHFAQ